MSEFSVGPPSAGGTPAGAVEKLLGELEEALRQQLVLAGKSDFEGMLAATEKLEELLRRAQKLPRPLPASCADRLGRIQASHGRLRLTLAQRKEELAHELDQVRLGKRTLRAYGGGAHNR